MKKIIFCLLIVISYFNVFSQVNNVNDFFSFANLSHKKRIEYLKEKNWKQTGYTIHEIFGSWYNEELTFERNDTNYGGGQLTLSYNVERNDTTLTVKFNIDEDLYKIWVKKLKSLGYDFQKDEEFENSDIYKAGIENDPNLLKDSYIQIEVECAEGSCWNYISIVENYSFEENETKVEKIEVIETEKPREVFSIVDEEAEFVGKIDEWISKNLIYPKTAFDKGCSGKCYVRFVVNSDGTISNVSITRGVTDCPELDEEAKRVVRLMPKWKPGKSLGKEVKSWVTIPINFTLYH